MLADSAVVAWFWPFAREEPHGHPPFYAIVGMIGDGLVPSWEPLPRARLGPMLVFAAAGGTLFGFAARRWGLWAAAGRRRGLALQPRLFAHAHYATYDALLTSLWVAALIAFLLAVERPSEAPKRPRWGWVVAFGILLGWSMGTKLTGWFLPLPCLAWAALYRDRRAVLTLLVGGFVGLATVYAFTPPWWHAPLSGPLVFFQSNLTRGETIPIETLFLGRTYETPTGSLPWYNTLVWTLFVVPVGFLLLAILGVSRALARFRSERAGVILTGNWLFFLILRALPHTPGHDGIRQFLPAFGLLAAVSGMGAAWVVDRWGRRGMALVVLALIEGGSSTALMMPVPLSYNSPIVGGLPGAAALGMEPTYYWDALTPDALDWIDRNTPEGRTVLFATNPTSWFYLRETGRLRPGLAPIEPGVPSLVRPPEPPRRDEAARPPAHLGCVRPCPDLETGRAAGLGVPLRGVPPGGGGNPLNGDTTAIEAPQPAELPPRPQTLTGRAWWVGCVLVFVGALVATAPTLGDFGLTYDEPAYRYSQQVSQQWWERLGRGEFEAVLEPDALLYYWPYARHGINFHPPLAGQLNLLTYALSGGVLKDIPARRLATTLEYSLAITLLFGFLARRYNLWVGLTAAVALLTMPRVYGQAHLIDTDTLGMLLWLATALAFWKGLNEPGGRRWRVLVGVLMGLAFVQKMAAVFVLVPLMTWLVAARLPGAFRRGQRAALVDGVVTSVALLVPLGIAYVEIRRLAGLLPPPQLTDLFRDRPPSRLPGAFLLAPMGVWLVREALRRLVRGNRFWGVERPALETWAAILAFATAVGWLGNPAWWRETFPRLAHYYMLSTARRGALPDIHVLYFGRLYEFALPWQSAWVLLAITVPVSLLAAGAVGVLVCPGAAPSRSTATVLRGVDVRPAGVADRPHAGPRRRAAVPAVVRVPGRVDRLGSDAGGRRARLGRATGASNLLAGAPGGLGGAAGVLGAGAGSSVRAVVLQPLDRRPEGCVGVGARTLVLVRRLHAGGDRHAERSPAARGVDLLCQRPVEPGHGAPGPPGAGPPGRRPAALEFRRRRTTFPTCGC